MELIHAEEAEILETFSPEGPYNFRNNMPLYLFFLAMPAEKASVLEQHDFSFSTDYTVSNITSSAFTPVSSLYDVQIDAEVSRLDFKLRYGLFDKTEVAVNFPLIRLGAGYLDSFVEQFEDVFGFVTPRSRKRQGRNNYLYSIKYDRRFLIHTTTATEGLGDASLHLKYQLFSQEFDWTSLSLRSALKLPTGDRKKLLGSGKTDFGFGVVLDHRWNRRLSSYLNLDYLLIQTPDTLKPLDMDSFIIASSATIEYLFTTKYSMLLTLAYHTTPYPESQTNVLDESPLDVLLGFRYQFTKNLSWSGNVQENFYAASPDVSFQTGFQFSF